MKYSNWKIPPAAPAVPRVLLEAGCTPLLAAVLQLRGLGNDGDAEQFLCGGAETLHDPLQLENILDAVGRLSRAITASEHVAVYGDYDVDGITAACLLSDYLSSRGLPCETYIPNRLTEGYGLNRSAIDTLAARGVTLIVTVDCGVTNIGEVAYARSLGIDMIVTDHHECREILPDAEAVVDPKRADCTYPGTGLAGVGVAFKLVCAMDGNTERMLERYGDLLAVGTVADVMPVTGENRYLIRKGLELIADGRCRPGLTALMRRTGASEKKLTASVIGYTLAPRINAAGRLGETDTAVELLTTTNRARAEELAEKLDFLNRERRDLESDIMCEAVRMLDAAPPDGPIVLAGEGWHPGVIGIAASRLSDLYARPAVMICLDSGKGSCRSAGGFNLFEALGACEDCLDGFGGHAMAAGLTVKPGRVDELRERLREYYLAHPSHYVPALEPDLEIEQPDMLDEASVESLDLLEPCGNGNPRPLFYLSDAVLDGVTPIGEGKHLRFRLKKFGTEYDCVFFAQSADTLGAVSGDRVDAVFSVQINDFRSRRTVQLVMTDLRRHKA